MNKKYFEKKVNKNNYKEMFEFLKNHFTYFTMESWNGLESIANNVKIYNIGLNYNILGLLLADNYSKINNIIEDWEEKNTKYLVGFNGRSGGYLVLYNKYDNNNVLDDYFDYCCDYEEFKKCIRRDYGSLKEYKDRLISQTKIVCSFDKLCDTLRLECLSMEYKGEVKNENSI